MDNASAHLADAIGAIDGGETELDLAALGRSDSSAVAVLLAAARHAIETGESVRGRTAREPLRLTGMPESVASLASLYGVDQLLNARVPATAPPA